MALDKSRYQSVQTTPLGQTLTPPQTAAVDQAQQQLYQGQGGIKGPTAAATSYAPPKPAAAPHGGPAGGYAPPAAATQSPYGYASGPGILESWFNQRANGMDPGWQYAMGRGMDSIDNRMAAGGSFNSGARGQQLSDFAANMGAQREGQLDALAAGASGEYQGRLNSMFGQGMGLAGGQAGTMGAYDINSANANNAAMQALMQIYGNKAGVDSQSSKQGLGNIIGLIGAL